MNQVDFNINLIKKMSLFGIESKEEYPTTPPFSSDERAEEMETESAGPNPGFGSIKGY